jgi:hypothetical protein
MRGSSCRSGDFRIDKLLEQIDQRELSAIRGKAKRGIVNALTISQSSLLGRSANSLGNVPGRLASRTGLLTGRQRYEKLFPAIGYRLEMDATEGELMKLGSLPPRTLHLPNILATINMRMAPPKPPPKSRYRKE